MAIAEKRTCKVGYNCGGACISKSKVCLKKIGSEKAKAVAKRLIDSINEVNRAKAEDRPARLLLPKEEEGPDIISDV